MLLLLLLRHAESAANQVQRMQSSNNTDPLSERGAEQAQRLGHQLKLANWCPTHIYCSPALRTHQTLEILLRSQFSDSLPTKPPILHPDSPDMVYHWTPSSSSEPVPISITYTHALSELNPGIFDGLTWAEAQAQYPDLCEKLLSTLDWVPIPNAESPDQGRDRVQQFIQQLIDQHQNCDRIWIITHAGILPYLVAALLGCDRAWGFAAQHTARFEFTLDQSRWPQPIQRNNTTLWRIERFNDTSHLI
ncbi:MAG: histidine phosphatase family protein [Thainema sp.]